MTVDTAIGAVGLVVDEGQGPPTLVVVVELEPTAKPEWAAPCSEPAPVLRRGEQIIKAIHPTVGIDSDQHGVIDGDG